MACTKRIYIEMLIAIPMPEYLPLYSSTRRFRR
jgi:hypothetical protein